MAEKNDNPWRDRENKDALPGRVGVGEKTNKALLSAAQSLEKAALVMSGEGLLDLPKKLEDQRGFVRGILEGVEKSGRDCVDYANVAIVRKLETSLDRIHPQIAEETKLRLAIHDSAELIKQSAGFIERKDNGLTASGALSETARRGHDLTRRGVEIFFKEGLPGLKTHQAWDLLEFVNFHYAEVVARVDQMIFDNVWVRLSLSPRDRFAAEALLKRGNFDARHIINSSDKDDNRQDGLSKNDKQWLIRTLGEDNLNLFHSVYGFELSDAERELGQVPSNFFTDSDVPRKEAVYRFMITQLGGDHSAVTSLRLAEKMAVATFETSVWNKSALSGNDELAEIIGLFQYRARRRKIGRNAGPAIHVDTVPGFGTSWIRLQQNEANEVDMSQPLFSKNIDPSRIASGSHQAFGPASLNRFQALRNLLMDREPKPEITATVLQNAVPYFMTADRAKNGEKCGPLKLKVWWLAGVVDMALSHIDLGWTPKDLEKLRVAVSVQELAPGVGSFISEAQWVWIEKATSYKSRLPMHAFKGFADSISISGAPSSGGGKKR